MDALKHNMCATCPDRGKLSAIAVRIALGLNYKAEDCEGRRPVRQDNAHFSLEDGSLSGGISSIEYGCGKAPEDGEQLPDFIAYNWDNGRLVSTINHTTDVYTNYRDPELSDKPL